jgi:hypothetical protein
MSWIIERGTETLWIGPEKACGGKVGDVVVGLDCGDHKTDDSNERIMGYARLIAAAPDLLSILNELFCEGPVQVLFAGNPIACEDLEKRARAAIAKAEAGQ